MCVKPSQPFNWLSSDLTDSPGFSLDRIQAITSTAFEAGPRLDGLSPRTAERGGHGSLAMGNVPITHPFLFVCLFVCLFVFVSSHSWASEEATDIGKSAQFLCGAESTPLSLGW